MSIGMLAGRDEDGEMGMVVDLHEKGDGEDGETKMKLINFKMGLKVLESNESFER